LAGFLTDAWLDELDDAARSATAPAMAHLVVQQVVPDGPEGHEVAYAVVLDEGRVRIERGRVVDPDVTFTQDRATAEAIHQGQLSAQAAFMQGRLRLGGDLRAVIDRAVELAAIDDLFGGVRA
jgi:predicted lipid carrier protein YhbT